MKLPVLSVEGKELRSLEVDESVFGIEPNQSVLHQAFVTQRNNQRAGTASTKTRSEVQGSTRKVRMQKYTGRARHGGARAPIFAGGGIAFGPRPRSFALSLNKKMRRLAIRSALSGKVADSELVIVDDLNFPAPKTKEVLRVLRNVGIERSALIVTGQPDRTIVASARNLAKMKVLPAAYLNVADVLNHRHLLMTEAAVKVAEGLWGDKRADARPSGRPKQAPSAEVSKRRPTKAAPEREPTVEAAAPQTAAETPKRTRAKAAAPAETAAKPTAEVKKPRARARAAKPALQEPAGDAEKPKRTTRRPKASQEGSAPKPRRRTKSDESSS
jgi:large subunit ribosomal protein L4